MRRGRDRFDVGKYDRDLSPRWPSNPGYDEVSSFVIIRFMKKQNSKKLPILLISLAILGLGCLIAKPYVNRLLDNQDRDTMRQQVLSMERQIRVKANAQGKYPSSSEVRSIVAGYKNPHTGKPYELVTNVPEFDESGDGQIAYGLGGTQDDCEANPSNVNVAHVYYGISLPRVHEYSRNCKIL